MRQSLSAKVLSVLMLTILVSGLVFAFVARRLTEGLLLDHFRQDTIRLARHLNQIVYRDYVNPWYEREASAFDPLAVEHLDEFEALIGGVKGYSQAERITFYSMTGQILYSTEKSLAGIDASRVPHLRQALHGEAVSTVLDAAPTPLFQGREGPPQNGPTIAVYLPMICLNEKLPQYQQQVGVIELYRPLAVLRPWTNKVLVALAMMVTVLSILVSLGAFSALYLAALKPIRNMIAAVADPHAIANGRLTRPIDGGTTRELKRLASSFTQMVEGTLEQSGLLREVQELAVVDELTSLYNHRCFHNRLEEELGRAERARSRVSLMFGDLDGFKAMNDAKGHQAGDKALQEVARILRAHKRVSDIACRYGGDEFALILPDTASREARPLAERLREAVASRFGGKPEHWGEGLTLSIGIACYPEDAQNKEGLIERADWAMYFAKRSGKNAVSLFNLTDFADFDSTARPDRRERIDSLRGLLGSIANQIGYLGLHSEAVARHAASLAQKLGLTASEVDRIVLASLLHDIGLMVLPSKILAKQGLLSAEEMERVQQHPGLALSLLDLFADIQDVLPIIQHHHEKYDGQGYPGKLAGSNIPLGARILSVADAYAAMRADRPYRRALGYEEAIAELRRCSGTHFDPEVVEAFIEYLSGQGYPARDKRF